MTQITTSTEVQTHPKYTEIAIINTCFLSASAMSAFYGAISLAQSYTSPASCSGYINPLTAIQFSISGGLAITAGVINVIWRCKKRNQ